MSDYRVLVTGWRDWPKSHAFVIEHELDRVFLMQHRSGSLARITVMHGQCPYGGVDLYAARWAEAHAFVDPEPHPAETFGNWPACGPRRNSHMVNLGADLCLSFPGPGSSGTWDCTRKAVDAGIPMRSIGWAIQDWPEARS